MRETNVVDAIRAEIAGHEDAIEKLKKALAALDNGSPQGRANAAPKRRGRPPKAEKTAEPKKRKMSAAGRKRIGDAAKARWAKLRAEKAKAEK